MTLMPSIKHLNSSLPLMHSTQRRTTVDERIFSWTFLKYGKVHIPTRLVENPRNLCNQCWKENFSSSTAILATLVVPISCRHCRTFHTTYQDSHVLTDPVVMSSDKEKRFGALILEAKGLAFFSLITSAIASARVLGWSPLVLVFLPESFVSKVLPWVLRLEPRDPRQSVSRLLMPL